MKLRIFLLVVVVALIAGVMYRIQGQQAGEGRKGDAERALSVKTVAVTQRDFPRVIDLPGTLEATQQVAIVAQATGTVLRQNVQEGDIVRAGDVLFSLDARPAEARMAQSRAALTGARAEAAEAEKKIERLGPLMEPGYISRQELADAQLMLEAARARSDTARAELEAARLEAQYAQIRTPIAGRIGRIGIRVGSVVQAGAEPLTTVIAPGALDVRASVAQQDWPELAAARMRGKVMAEIRQESDSTVQARGELVFVDAQIDAATGAVPIKVRLSSPSAGLLPGQGVRVRLLLGTESNAKVLPEVALQYGQAGSYVYVVRGGKAVVQPVEVIRGLDGELMVAGELREGEPVLVEVPQRLKAGNAVRLEAAGGTAPSGNRAPTGTGTRR